MSVNNKQTHINILVQMYYRLYHVNDSEFFLTERYICKNGIIPIVSSLSIQCQRSKLLIWYSVQ